MFPTIQAFENSVMAMPICFITHCAIDDSTSLQILLVWVHVTSGG
tara:strand:- start:44 stop:178 length:135 start_codon:yes stop_codon:yes gene_type:complete